MNTETLSGARGRLALGMALMGLGLLLALVQTGVIDVEGLGRFWPLLPLGIGWVKVRQPIEHGQRAIGVALLFVGGLFQLVSILTWSRAWPLVLVLAGGFLLWQSFERPPLERVVPASTSPDLAETIFIGASKRMLGELRGGYITAVMGGVELDLRKCRLTASPAVIDVVTLWGGIDLKVPADWVVEGSVVPFMGGFEDKTKTLAAPADAPRLVVRGYAVMGAVIIGN